MKLFRQTKISDLPIQKDSYIYSISSTAEKDDLRFDSNRLLTKSDQLLALSSDNSLLVLDPETLSVVPNGHFRNVSSSVTVAKYFGGNEIISAGRDGDIAFWDLRHGKTKSLTTPQGPKEPISALACNKDAQYVAAGTELEGNGPGDVSVFVWDLRNPSTVLRKYTESHTDTVTELRFLPYPSQASKVLLSGSTDGLVNVFDTTQAEEEDAVLQVINHRSAIHRTGLVGDDIYALGTDETLSFYAQQSPDVNDQEPEPYALGDIREMLSCEYAVKIWNDQNPLLVVGNHSNHANVQLIPMRRAELSDTSPPKWATNIDARIELVGGHGEEIVRDVYVDADSKIVYSCGEDGIVRQWCEHELQDIEMTGSTPVKRKTGDMLERSEKKKKK
jgi:WD repeat-containing protein 89